MFGIPENLVIPIVNIIGIAFLGIAAAIGHRWGKSRQTPAEQTVEVAGALVDNRAVDRLTAALEAHTMALAAAHADHEKARQLGYKLAEALGKVADEVEELRRAAQDVATQIARKI